MNTNIPWPLDTSREVRNSQGEDFSPTTEGLGEDPPPPEIR